MQPFLPLSLASFLRTAPRALVAAGAVQLSVGAVSSGPLPGAGAYCPGPWRPVITICHGSLALAPPGVASADSAPRRHLMVSRHHLLGPPWELILCLVSVTRSSNSSQTVLGPHEQTAVPRGLCRCLLTASCGPLGVHSPSSLTRPNTSLTLARGVGQWWGIPRGPQAALVGGTALCHVLALSSDWEGQGPLRRLPGPLSADGTAMSLSHPCAQASNPSLSFRLSLIDPQIDFVPGLPTSEPPYFGLKASHGGVWASVRI